MQRPRTHTKEEQQRLETLEENMIAFNVIKLKVVYALEVLSGIESEHEAENEILRSMRACLMTTLEHTMHSKMKTFEKIKKLAYAQGDNDAET